MIIMIRAIFFDFDGVLADTEPVHLRMFQEVLQDESIQLTKQKYYQSYLGLDDRSCFRQVFVDQGKTLTSEQEDQLVMKKSQKILAWLRGKNLLLPGVKASLELLKDDYYLAVVSGALRQEVIETLSGGGIEGYFRVILGADQVTHSKPHPEGYELTLQQLNRDHIPASEILLPAECVVVEDSPWGISAGRQAGMRCIAITNSYPKDKLQGADLVVSSLSEISKDLLAKFS